MTTSDAFEFVGGLLSALFGITGMVVWLRWGWAGVAILWSKRQELDETVERELAGLFKVPR